MGAVKELLKKNQRITEGYRLARKKTERFLSLHAPKLLSRIQYRQCFGRKLDLKNPVYLNEKLMWLKFNRYTDNPLVTKCIDKYAVRDYVKECGLEGILNDLIGVWDRAQDIDWDALPDSFAIKCNHGCGFNIICKDKSCFDYKAAEKKLDEWMHKESWTEHAETNYRGIPHKIICEKYLKGKEDALPVDYKVYCFNGKPMYIGNFIDRNIEKGTIIRGYFDVNWKPSPVFKYMNDMDLDRFPKPKALDEMLAYAEKLSKPFPFVRVDFYEVDGKVIFGELTFTPTGCLGRYYTKEASLELGNLLNIKA